MDNIVFSWGIYLLGSLFVGCVLGIISATMPQTEKLPISARFLLGFSCTPYIIGIYTLIMTCIPFKMQNVMYILPIYILALVILIYKRRSIESIIEKIMPHHSSYEVIIAIGAFACVLLSKAFVEGLCKAQLEFAKLHQVEMIKYFALFLFAFFLGIIFYRFRKQEKISWRCIFLFILLLIVFNCSSYIFLNKIWGILYFNRIQCLALVLCQGCLLFLTLYFFTNDKKKYTFDKCFRLTISYVFTMEAILYLKSVARRICDRINIYNLKGTNIDVFVEALVYSLLIASTIIMVCIVNLDRQKKGKLSSINWNNIFTILVDIFTIIIMARILTMITDSSFAPVIGADANQYMSEALAFAKEMRITAMNGYRGSLDGSLLANIHHPAWPAYLANAMLYNFKGNLGYPNDVAVRLAIQMTYIYLIAAVLAFSRMIGTKRRAQISIILLFMYKHIFYVYSSASRDAYRIIAIFVFGTVLFIMNSKIKQNEKIDYGYAIMLFLASSFVMMGHPINAIVAIAIGVSFTIVLIIQKKFTLNVVKYYSFAIAGALLGSLQMILALINTGKMTGGLIDLDQLFVGTDYYDNYMAYTQSRLLGTVDYFDRIKVILERDNGLLSIIGIICTIIVMVSCLKKTKEKINALYLSAIVIFNCIFLTDVFKWSGIKLTEWCVMNIRYTLQFYVFWGIIIAYVIEGIFTRFQNKKSLIHLMIIMVCFGYILMPDILIKSNYDNKSLCPGNVGYVKNYEMDNVIVGELDGKRLLIDNFYMNYYLNNQAMSIFTEPAEKIRKATTEEELYRELVNNNIGAVLITNSYIDLYWKNTTLEKFVNSRYISQCIETDINKIYILN